MSNLHRVPFLRADRGIVKKFPKSFCDRLSTVAVAGTPTEAYAWDADRRIEAIETSCPQRCPHLPSQELDDWRRQLGGSRCWRGEILVFEGRWPTESNGRSLFAAAGRTSPSDTVSSAVLRSFLGQ